MNTITVTRQDGQTLECPVGTSVGTILDDTSDSEGLPYIAALVNNNVSSMSYPLSTDCSVELLTMANPHGWRVYRRSLSFIVAKAVNDLYPDAAFSVEHSFGQGLYCSFHLPADSDTPMSDDQLKAIQDRVTELIEQDLPIERHKIAYADAVANFSSSGQTDKLNLLKFRNPPRIVIHSCGGFSDLAHGPLAPATGVLNQFKLIPYPPGFVLAMPDRNTPKEILPFEDQPNLFNIFQEHKEWGRIVGVTTVGQLNEMVAAGEVSEIIRLTEALHEKKIARIADEITAAKDRVKLILIAGPSSAGKTTFAKKLTIYLKVNGIRPVTLGTDDYFVGEDSNPVDEDGKPDLEHIEAVDLELFNSDILKLVQGKEIEMPRFNFEAKKREYKGDMLHIEDDQVVIIEGIHGLNPRLTEQIPSDCEFKIYVSALTQLSVDSNNRISTTDNRLMRRIVRDANFRGHPALGTLKMWPSVRRGEKRWIFPFQREAHATFNSALDYELAVLKPLVEPLLMQVKPSDPEYAEARRLSEFLLNFVGVSALHVPPTSLLREYIGGSSFDY
jgi:uridine kinase